MQISWLSTLHGKCRLEFESRKKHQESSQRIAFVIEGNMLKNHTLEVHHKIVAKL